MARLDHEKRNRQDKAPPFPPDLPRSDEDEARDAVVWGDAHPNSAAARQVAKMDDPPPSGWWQCQNLVGTRPPLRQCERKATGTDGYCNICRAAKARVEKRLAEQYQQVDAALRVMHEAELRVKAGQIIEAEHPELWAEAMQRAEEG